MAFTEQCGKNIPPSMQILSEYAGGFPFFITDTDNDIAVLDMTVEGADYEPGPYFTINIETAGDICVQLASGRDFRITAVQAASYTGFWYPALIKRVYRTMGVYTTTGTFSVGK